MPRSTPIQSGYPAPPPVWLIATSIACSVMALTILTPALPLIQAEFSASSSAVQQLLTVYMVALAIGQLVCGTLSDQIGRRPVLLAGALLFAVSGAAAILATSIEILTLFRVVQGLGAAACMAMGRSIINDCFARSDAARQMSAVSVLIAVVPILSLGLGGVLVQNAGWMAAMVLTSFSGFALFLLAWLKLPETHPDHGRNPASMAAVFSAYASVIKNRLFFFFAMCSGMQVGMFFALNGFIPYQYERLGFTPGEFGIWFALTPVCYLLGNWANSQYFVARGIERAAMIGASLTLVSVILFYGTQAAGMTHALSLALPGCLFGFGNGIVVANVMVGAMSAAGKHAGTGTGLAGAWQMAAGGLAGAVIVAFGGAQSFLTGVAGLVLMSLISVFSMWSILRLQRD